MLFFLLGSIGTALLAVVALIAIYLFIFTVILPLRERSLYAPQGIPMTPFVPLLGDLAHLRKCRETLPFDKWFTEIDASLGPVHIFQLGPEQRLRVRSLDAVRAVLVTHAAHFHKTALMRKTLGRLLSTGLLTAEGDVHRAHRGIISPAFHFAALQSMAPLIARASARAVRKLLDTAATAPLQPIDFHEEGSGLTLYIIAEAAFGARFDGLLPPPLAGEEGGAAPGASSSSSSADASFMYDSTKALLASIVLLTQRAVLLLPGVSTLSLLFLREVNGHIDRLRVLGRSLIGDRRRVLREAAAAAAAAGAAPPQPQLLLDYLLSSAQGSGGHGSGAKALSDENILDESLTFVMAGHETTAQALTFALLLLAQHPEWRTRMREQLTAVLGSPPRLPTSNDLASLPLLSAILSETMRLYPPAPQVARLCMSDVELPCADMPGGVLHVYKGTNVIIPISAIHRDETLWGEDAEQFNPGRWLSGGEDPALLPKRHPLAYMPFSIGSRNCVGSAFALLEAKIILAVIISRCDWDVHDSYVHRTAMAITLRPVFGLPLLFKPLVPVPAGEGGVGGGDGQVG